MNDLTAVQSEIIYRTRPSAFTYDLYLNDTWCASVRYQGAGDMVADELTFAHLMLGPALDTLAERRACCDGWSGAAACPDCDPMAEPVDAINWNDRCGHCGSKAHDTADCPLRRCDALLDEADQVLAARVCLICGGDHSADQCPRIRLAQACPGAALFPCDDLAGPDGGYCPRCAAALDRITTTIAQLGAGTVCTNCGEYGHSAAQCPYAPLPLPGPRKLTARARLGVILTALMLGGFVLLACAGDATCSPRNDGSYAAAQCTTR